MKNKKRELLQVLFLIAVALLPWIIDFSGFLTKAITAGMDVDFKYYVAITSGKGVAGFVLLALAYVYIVRRSNKEYIFNESGNAYYNHSYAWYWICGNIFGYKKCSLVRVPIPMQFKLLINQVFREYTYGNDNNYVCTTDEEILVSIDKGKTEAVNLVLSDTYPISNDLLPGVVREYKTVRIKREHTGDGNRYISDTFCSEVQKIVYRLVQSGCDTLNIFPTTNAAHNIRIVQNSFMQGGRGDIKHIYVFSQPHSSEGDWRFSDKGVEVR